MTPKQDILNYLTSKGILSVGFCKAEPMLEYAFFILNEHKEKAIYFDIGFEKTIENRSWYDPLYHLPTAKSIITVLMPYNMKRQRYEEKPELAFSKASLFRDYHVTMDNMLKDLSEYIETRYNKSSLAFCDTGPLNDKAILLRTQSVKLLNNSLLYHKDYGSRFYIGYIITELDLTRTKQAFDINEYIHPFCGSCQRCRAACPNKAIEEHGHLTSSKCISFLTQSKNWESLPDDLSLKGYVYGCDICQLVCPLNGKSLDEYNHKPVINEELIIKDIEIMTNKEFKVKYNTSSAGWIGKKRILRNAYENIKKMNQGSDKNGIL